MSKQILGAAIWKSLFVALPAVHCAMKVFIPSPSATICCHEQGHLSAHVSHYKIKFKQIRARFSTCINFIMYGTRVVKGDHIFIANWIAVQSDLFPYPCHSQHAPTPTQPRELDGHQG